MKYESRRIIALLLLFAAITGLVASFGENILCAGELPGAHETSNASSVHAAGQVHDSTSPDTPSSPDSSNDHFCTDGCGCPCQAPISPSPMLFRYSPSFTYLHHNEVTSHIPEVYLSLFVPPDSATV